MLLSHIKFPIFLKLKLLGNEPIVYIKFIWDLILKFGLAWIKYERFTWPNCRHGHLMEF